MPEGFVTKKISKPRTLGSILKAARSKANLSIEQVQEQTKICTRYILALEEGNYAQLPAEAYNIGFVRSYASFLRLNQDKILRMYREERSDHRMNASENKVLMQPRRLGEWRFLITPKLLAVIGTLVFFGGLAGYVFLQLNRFAQPPELVITNVPSEFTSSRDSVRLQGQTTEGATVLMNSEAIAVTADGSFSQDVQLNPGINEINVLARSRAQKEKIAIVKVLYNPDLAKATENVTN
jgi:cytoskeletal protein RodZ